MSNPTSFTEATSVFERYRPKNFPYQYRVGLVIGTLAGGTPTDPKVAEGWLRSKWRDKDDLIREAVAETMTERGLTEEEATEAVNAMKHLNGFKREEGKGLFIEGRQVKAMLKEAASIAVSSGNIKGRGWGTTNKGLKSFVAEHAFVTDDRVFIQQYDESGNLVAVKEPTGIMQRFVSTWKGTGIQYEEFVQDAYVTFTIEADHEFTEQEWSAMLLTAERNGLGASRSQGYGKFKTVQFDRLDPKTGRIVG